MYHFKGLIRCANCAGNFRGKQERGKTKYFCSTYHNYPDRCERFIIKEEDLLWLIQRHEAEVGDIKEIVADPKKQSVTIYYKDGSNSIMSPSRLKS